MYIIPVCDLNKMRLKVTKKQNKLGRPILMPHPWGTLAEAIGGTFILAEKLGVKQPTIHRWAHGKSRIPLTTIKEIKRLCAIYKIQDCTIKNKDDAIKDSKNIP